MLTQYIYYLLYTKLTSPPKQFSTFATLLALASESTEQKLLILRYIFEVGAGM